MAAAADDDLAQAESPSSSWWACVRQAGHSTWPARARMCDYDSARVLPPPLSPAGHNYPFRTSTPPRSCPVSCLVPLPDPARARPRARRYGTPPTAPPRPFGWVRSAPRRVQARQRQAVRDRASPSGWGAPNVIVCEIARAGGTRRWRPAPRLLEATREDIARHHEPSRCMCRAVPCRAVWVRLRGRARHLPPPHSYSSRRVADARFARQG